MIIAFCYQLHSFESLATKYKEDDSDREDTFGLQQSDNLVVIPKLQTPFLNQTIGYDTM